MMNVRIKSNDNNDYYVEWMGRDGFIRKRKRPSRHTAEIYACQRACVLEIEAYQRELNRVSELRKCVSNSKANCTHENH